MSRWLESAPVRPSVPLEPAMMSLPSSLTVRPPLTSRLATPPTSAVAPDTVTPLTAVDGLPADRMMPRSPAVAVVTPASTCSNASVTVDCEASANSASCPATVPFTYWLRPDTGVPRLIVTDNGLLAE